MALHKLTIQRKLLLALAFAHSPLVWAGGAAEATALRTEREQLQAELESLQQQNAQLEERLAELEALTEVANRGVQVAEEGFAAREEALETAVQRLEAENLRLREIFVETQFLLSLYTSDVPDLNRVESAEQLRVQSLFEDVESVFDTELSPTLIAEDLLLSRPDGRELYSHPEANRFSPATAYVELELIAGAPTAFLVLETLTPVNRRPIVLESATISVGDTNQTVQPERITRLRDERFTAERIRLALADGSTEIARLLVAPNSAVTFNGINGQTTELIDPVERQAIRELLFLYRQFGGRL